MDEDDESDRSSLDMSQSASVADRRPLRDGSSIGEALWQVSGGRCAAVSCQSMSDILYDEDEHGEEEEEEQHRRRSEGPSEHHACDTEPTMIGRPGFDERHYGRGIVARPMLHGPECNLEWEEYNEALCTDAEGNYAPLRPVRSMCVNIPSTFMSKGAIKASDFVSPNSPSERRRVEGSARLLSMFSAGASKRYVNGRHAHLEQYKDLEPEKLQAEKRKMDVNSYVYQMVDENHPGETVKVPQMFMYGCEAVYDQDGIHIICFRYWKLINDHAYSDSFAWKKIMEENSQAAHGSRMNRSSRYKRSSNLLQDSKAARSITRSENISDTGESLYLNLMNVGDLRTMYKTYAGTTEDSSGAAVFDERLLPAGLMNHELSAHKAEREQLGGLHPLGPETALNARRLPPDGEIGPCPLTAGMVDLHGNLLVGHEDQMHPSKYFNEDGDLVLPKFVEEKGAFKIMVNPYQLSIFDADLPHPTCGSEEPADCILFLWWEVQKDTNQILVTARETAQKRNLDPDNWLHFRNEIFRAIGQQMADTTGLSKDLCRAMQQSSLFGMDLLELTDEDRAKARAVPQWRSYEARTLEPFQILKQNSSEISNLYAFVRAWRFDRDRHWATELEKVKEDPRATVEVENKQHMDHRRHTDLRRAVIKLALQKMQNAFDSHSHRKSIPPGWLAIWDSLQEEIKRAGAVAAASYGQAAGSMVVDPTDPQSSIGSAAVGQLFRTGYTNFDVNSQGMFMELVMNLLNGEQGIQGPSTFITMAMHYAQYQVAQTMSFILAICGAGSTGKSERAALLMETQLPGWWVSGGGKSEMADFNGMDDSCGRAVHLDEITKEFTSTGAATEKIKEITMKNSCTRSRSVKTKSASGAEEWKTEVVFSLHYECFIITTNCGLCLQHGNEEPNESRHALFDRMITFPAPPVTNVAASSKDAVHQQRHMTRGAKTAERIIQYRIVCGLTWIVLLLIKHIPDFHPANSEWAQRLFNDMDESLVSTVPNVQRASPRKQQLRSQTLMAICVQKEIVRKFFTVEGCLQHDDLKPQNGYLPVWNITQLVDVVQRLNYSPADVFEAWSHSLDYNPSTSSICFHVRQMVAMSHGVAMDDRFPKCGTTEPPSQAQDVSVDRATRRRGPPEDELLYPGDYDADNDAGAPCLAPGGIRIQEHAAAARLRKEDLDKARIWANHVVAGTNMYSPMSEKMGLTVGDASARAASLSRKRQLTLHAMKTRCDVIQQTAHPGDVMASFFDLLNTGETSGHATPGETPVAATVTRFGDMEQMDTYKAAGSLCPTLNDACCCGYEASVLMQWLQGLPTQTGKMTMLDRRLGTCRDDTSWSFVCINKDPKEATAAQFNTMWRVANTESVSEGSGWREAARAVAKGGCDAGNVGMYGTNLGITHATLRDALWLLSTCKDTIIGKNSNRVFVSVGTPDVPDADALCTETYGAMRSKTDPVWQRGPPVVSTEAENGDPVRAFGAEMWNLEHPDPAASLRFVSKKPLETHGNKGEELVVRRFQKLFQVGGLPACNPFSIGAVETGSMIRMDRNTMHVNSLSIMQHMRLFMEISYFLATHPETRNKSGVSRSRIPSTLVREDGTLANPVSVHRDRSTLCQTPVPEGGLRDLARPMNETNTEGFEQTTQGNPALDDLCRSLTDTGADAGASSEADGVAAALAAAPGVVSPTHQKQVEDESSVQTQRLRNLGFSFEMFSLWATLNMASRWSNDCEEHVKGVVKGREHIFGTAESVLSTLPKMTTKFCSFSNLEENNRVSEDYVCHDPISVDLSRKSTYDKKLPSIYMFSKTDILEIQHRFERYMQRTVTNSEMYEELNSKLLSIGGIPGVRGNLWARSTWELASRNSLIDRGQAHGGEGDMDLFHARDSDLDIRLRMLALLSQKNPEDVVIQNTIGNRQNARYNPNRPATAHEIERAAESQNKLYQDDGRRHKRQRQGQHYSYSAAPMVALSGFTDKLAPRGESRSGGGAADPMDCELHAQQDA